MSKFMDKNGFCRKDYGNSVEEIRRGETWIQEYISRGASVAEAMLCISCILETARENIKYNNVQLSVKKRKNRNKTNEKQYFSECHKGN